MFRRICTLLALSTAIPFCMSVALAQETITLHSGNGSVGSLDSAISFVAKNGPYASADFDAARNGIKATIINNYPTWISSLAADPAAKWIAVNSSDSPQSVLYAYDFQVMTQSITSASLDLDFAVDDQLGAASVPGIYINGSAVTGTSGIGGFGNQLHLTDNTIGSLLRPGTNTFYFYQHDTGGVVAGSIFTAQITVIPASVPEPGAMATFIGIVIPGTILLLRRRRK